MAIRTPSPWSSLKVRAHQVREVQMERLAPFLPLSAFLVFASPDSHVEVSTICAQAF
jgi:hypothetical protein